MSAILTVLSLAALSSSLVATRVVALYHITPPRHLIQSMEGEVEDEGLGDADGADEGDEGLDEGEHATPNATLESNSTHSHHDHDPGSDQEGEANGAAEAEPSPPPPPSPPSPWENNPWEAACNVCQPPPGDLASLSMQVS